MTEYTKLHDHAKELRKNMTKEENLLWYHFLRKYPLRFRRQHVIGPYIVDFYCSKAHIVIELDGSQHYDPAALEYDRKRTAYLESQGLTVLRISNLDIHHQFSSVCSYIDMVVKQNYPMD